MIDNMRRSFFPVAGDMLAYCGISTSIVRRITCCSLCWKKPSLETGKDYAVDYKDNIDAVDKAKVIVTFKGNLQEV